DAFRLLGDDSGWWSPPYDAMMPVVACRESGWPAGESCTVTDTIWTARSTSLAKPCAFHAVAITDTRGAYRYAPDCQPDDAVQINFFAVPPVAENYFKRHHPEYRPVPPWHPDCPQENADGPALAIVYPRPGARLYIPR